jgi:hypothetical protein
MTAMQPDLFDQSAMARTLRDQGMEQAASHCPDAVEAAYAALKRLAQSQPTVHIDDFIPVLEMLPVKPQPNAMGTVWRRAKEDGLLEETGEYRACTKHAKKHAHKYPTYRSLVCTA